MIIPAVDEFEGDYTGQFLTILGRDIEEGDPQKVHDVCDQVPWPDEETKVNLGQLTDRQSDEPLAVRLPVYVDGRRQPITEDTMFVISNASTCRDDYVTVQTSSVRLRSVRVEPAGPAVTETDTETVGAGFGVAAGAVGGGVALLTRWFHGRE